MENAVHLLFRMLLPLWLLAGLGALNVAHAEPEPAMLTLSLSGKTMDQAVQDVKNAITSHNYTFVREQAIDSRLVPDGWEAKSVYIVYFCNFAKMNRALAIDVRAAQFLPCRITLLETRSGIDLVAVNPAWVSESLGNPLLHQDCLQLKADYLAILEEASL
jgi:cytochrome c oxidase cbb3-type subunit 3